MLSDESHEIPRPRRRGAAPRRRISMIDASGPRWTATEASEAGYGASAVGGYVTITSSAVEPWTWDALPAECAFP